MTKLYIDFETRSIADIKKVGAWKYAADPSTEIMCMAWAIDTGPVKIVTAGEFHHSEFFDGVVPGATIIAHNAHFEYAIWNLILHKRYGWPALWEPKHWSCTLSRAAMCNLPISLDACGAALGINSKKDLMGRSAMLKLSRPLSIDALDFPTYREDKELKETMYEYCRKDVEAEMELDARLPELPENERKIWELDLKINRRGVKADVLTAGRAVVLAESFTKTLNETLVALTGGAVEKASRVAAIKSYLASKGVVTESLDKAAVSALLSNPKISPKVKEVIKIRQQVGKSSTAKYQTILDYASDKDQRMRGMLQYHAAGTGRWGGRGPQPQNFPKGLGFESEEVVNDINSLSISDYNTKYGERSMDSLSAALRGVLMAGEGKVLVSADYSAIEARVLLWLCADSLALHKYRQGVNLYVDMAKFIYNNEAIGKDTHKKEYAVGKAAVLGCGYGMGKDKFYGTCASWGIDIPIETAEAAVQAYRKKYKKVVEFWYATEKAARAAVRTPGSVHSCGGGDLGTNSNIKAPSLLWGADKRREFLVCKLPSGRHLRYFRPSLRSIETPYGEKEEIHYWCAGLGGRLEENKTYGGSLVENIVQGTARDIMANGMLNAEAAGFPVILTVHDELVTEVVEDKKGAVDHLIKAMCSLPPWAAGCPIAAEGWMGKRYRK
jgi:DNA polymerase